MPSRFTFHQLFAIIALVAGAEFKQAAGFLGGTKTAEIAVKVALSWAIRNHDFARKVGDDDKSLNPYGRYSRCSIFEQLYPSPLARREIPDGPASVTLDAGATVLEREEAHVGETCVETTVVTSGDSGLLRKNIVTDCGDIEAELRSESE